MTIHFDHVFTSSNLSLISNMYIFNLLPEIILHSDEDDTMDVNGIVCEALVSIWSLDQVDSTYMYIVHINVYVVYLFVHTFSCNCKVYSLFENFLE